MNLLATAIISLIEMENANQFWELQNDPVRP